MAAAAGIAIVGAGGSGTALAVQLLRRTRLGVTLIERGPEFGPGLAYGTTCDAHLLNVRSGRMSVLAETPDDFVNWLALESPQEAAGDGFARRSTYGRYLRARLGEAEAVARGRLRRIAGEAAALSRTAERMTLTLADDTTIVSGAVVLALGNLPPEPMRLAGGETLGEALIKDPWAPGALASVAPEADVLMIGTGLTAIDVALALEAQGWRGRATMLSRRGLLPRPHDATAPHPMPERPATDGPLSRRLGAFRDRLDERSWGEAMDALRPFVAEAWRAASMDERGRFLRHLRPWWDVHRHRTAVEVGAAIQALVDAGRLRVAGGRLVRAARVEGRVRVDWRPRGDRAPATAVVDRLVVCTGPAFDLERTRDPLLGQLFRGGAVRSDPLRLGLDTCEDGRVIDAAGRPSSRLFAMGPLTRGAFWEIVAMPDIREQASSLAEALGRRFQTEATA